MKHMHVFSEQEFWGQLEFLSESHPTIRGVLHLRKRGEYSDLEILLRLAVCLGNENANLKEELRHSAQLRLTQPFVVPRESTEHTTSKQNRQNLIRADYADPDEDGSVSVYETPGSPAK